MAFSFALTAEDAGHYSQIVIRFSYYEVVTFFLAALDSDTDA